MNPGTDCVRILYFFRLAAVAIVTYYAIRDHEVIPYCYVSYNLLETFSTFSAPFAYPCYCCIAQKGTAPDRPPPLQFERGFLQSLDTATRQHRILGGTTFCISQTHR